MAGPSKRTAKGSSAPSKTSKTSKSSSDAGSKPPEPYALPPDSLKPFLQTLNPSHLYIVHVDRHPIALKQRHFFVPALVNLLVAAFIVFRAQLIFPWYLQLLKAVIDPQHPLRVGTAGAESGVALRELASRVGVFVLDFVLVRYAVPWPYDFFFRPGDSPTHWRTRVGFQAAEIAVRKSRSWWDKKLPADWLEDNPEGAKVYAERIMPSVDPRRRRERSAYTLQNASWELDYRAMVEAHELVADKAMALADFESTVVVHSEEHGWLVWELHKLDAEDASPGREKILELQEKLKDMGKEDLFFRWVEILQYETRQPGGFTDERQAKAMHETRTLFQAHGIDFDQFWAEVGGGQPLQGMGR